MCGHRCSAVRLETCWERYCVIIHHVHNISDTCQNKWISRKAGRLWLSMNNGLVDWYSITTVQTRMICISPKHLSLVSCYTFIDVINQLLPHRRILSVWCWMRGQVNLCLAYLALGSGNNRQAGGYTTADGAKRERESERRMEIGEVWRVAKLQVSKQQKNQRKSRSQNWQQMGWCHWKGSKPMHDGKRTCDRRIDKGNNGWI